MRPRTLGTIAGLLAVAVTALIALVVAPAGAQDSTTDDGEKAVLKIGWAQDPATLNPFTEVNEEGFNVWATQLGPARQLHPRRPQAHRGHRRELGGLGGPEDGHLQAQPRRQVVRRHPDHLHGRQVVAREPRHRRLQLLGLHRQGQVDRDPRRHHGRHQHHPARRPHGRRPLHLHPPRAHLGQGAAGRADRHLPARAAAGRQRSVHRHRVRAQPDRPHGAEPGVAGRGPELRRDPVHQVRHRGRGRARADPGRGRRHHRGAADHVRAPRRRAQHRHDPGRRRRPTPSSAFNLCSEQNCPDAEFNPAVQDVAVRQALAHTIDRERINEISALGTSFVANGILPQFYQTFYETPEQPYDPPDVEQAKQILDDAGWQDNGDEPRTKGDQTLSFDLFVRSESQSDTQAAKLIAEMAREIGVEFKVQVVSADKLTEIQIQDGGREAGPRLRHVRLGLGGRPVRPELPAQPVPDRPDRRQLGFLLLEPRVRQAVRRAGRGLRRRGAQGLHGGDGQPDPGGPALHRPHRGPEPAGLPDRQARQRRADVSGG